MEKRDLQLSLFENKEISTSKKNISNSIRILKKDIKEKLKDYNLEKYIFDIENYGLEITWDNICNYVILYGENKNFLNIANFGEMYEIGLAIIDKKQKKDSGQYYTPDDIAKVMGEWFRKLPGYNVCDVACGTGKLILTYLDILGKKESKKIIAEGRLYLYDFDKIALKICKTSIMIKYGIEYEDKINDICGDFLDKNIILPENAKVISNPPYAGISNFSDSWLSTPVLMRTKEYYSSFMEKIFKQSMGAVIITPFSFISGTKFEVLRQLMCKLGNGFIVSFDNVPGNIFCGRKYGIFNTNTSNSVRAAITVFISSKNKKGFRVSPLIRFKNEERSSLLVPKVLESTLPNKLQIIDNNKKTFEKIDKDLVKVFNKWVNNSKYTIKDITTNNQSKYMIYMPNTCRYFTTASYKKLNRVGLITINIIDEDIFNFVYCFINSSFAYWWWRVYDGGITYPVNLLYNMPLPINLLKEEDKEFFRLLCKNMIANEENYIVKKVNAGVEQENVKFPEEYRKKINKKILEILGFSNIDNVFSHIHSNSFFDKEGSNE